jgi:acetyl-CoA synthetase
MVERHRITTLGVSPTLIRALIPHGEEHVRRHDLSSLRILASTGEPWNPNPYLWFHEVVGGGRCPLINLSGGTEIGACFLSPHPITPLKPCTLRGPALGMDIAVYRADGSEAGPGEVGELVCRKTVAVDDAGPPRRSGALSRHLLAQVPRHMDARRLGPRRRGRLLVPARRSDDTISLAGKRLGPAEVESVLASHPAVAESAAVGVPHEVKGEAVWCFVVAKPGTSRSDDLAAELADLVAEHIGKAFRPSRVVFVDELPRTRSAKILRRAIRAAVAGEDPGDLSSLENPSALERIRGAVSAG